MYSGLITDFLEEKENAYEVEKELQDKQIELHNLALSNDIEIQNYCTKIKLVSWLFTHYPS